MPYVPKLFSEIDLRAVKLVFKRETFQKRNFFFSKSYVIGSGRAKEEDNIN